MMFLILTRSGAHTASATAELVWASDRLVKSTFQNVLVAKLFTVVLLFKSFWFSEYRSIINCDSWYRFCYSWCAGIV